MKDSFNIISKFSHSVLAGESVCDKLRVNGGGRVQVRDEEGNLVYDSPWKNMVVTVGKNQLLDGGLTGCYMGLISSDGYTTGAAAGDTMASHDGWCEASDVHAPNYTGNRQTCVFAAAGSGSKALDPNLTFVSTGTGTIKGAFIVFGAGASTTKKDTNGVLYCAGIFTNGDAALKPNYSLTISYDSDLNA